MFILKIIKRIFHKSKNKELFRGSIFEGNHERINVGSDVSIGPFNYFFLSENNILNIGDETYIGNHNNIRAAGGDITIGRKCLISQHVSIIAANHTFPKNRNIKESPWNSIKTGVFIEDDVWIGCNSVVLPGVILRKGTIIGAGSVVSKSTEEYGIYFGIPAQLKSFRK